jgi:hypothetical protein
MRKPIEANDGSYGGMVLAAFDALAAPPTQGGLMAIDTDFERELHRGMQAPPPGSLFETYAHRAARRVDDVIAGRDCPFPPDPEHVQLLVMLRIHQGRQRSVPLLALVERTHSTPRGVKQLVHDLRMHFGVLICSDRGGDGYWIAADPAEVEETLKPYRAQALSELRLCLAMQRGSITTDQFANQLRLELLEGEAGLATTK